MFVTENELTDKAVKQAREFLEQNGERDKFYDEQNHDSAFEVELEQRDNGSAMAEYLIERYNDRFVLTFITEAMIVLQAWNRTEEYGDGQALDDILSLAKDSELAYSYDLFDLLMKADGEVYTDGDLLRELFDVLASSINSGEIKPMELDVDYRQECDEWDERYTELYYDEENTQAFETYGEELEQLMVRAQALAAKYGTNVCQHIWTRVDGDDGSDIVLNGWHACNRIQYCLTEKPWGNGNKVDSNIYIEAKYS